MSQWFSLDFMTMALQIPVALLVISCDSLALCCMWQSCIVLHLIIAVFRAYCSWERSTASWHWLPEWSSEAGPTAPRDGLNAAGESQVSSSSFSYPGCFLYHCSVCCSVWIVLVICAVGFMKDCILLLKSLNDLPLIVRLDAWRGKIKIALYIVIL